MRKKLLTKLLMATILSTTISTGVAFAETHTEDIDKTNNKIVEEQQKSTMNKIIKLREMINPIFIIVCFIYKDQRLAEQFL